VPAVLQEQAPAERRNPTDDSSYSGVGRGSIQIIRLGTAAGLRGAERGIPAFSGIILAGKIVA